MGNLSKNSLILLLLCFPIGVAMTMFASNTFQLLICWFLCGIGGYAFGVLLAKNN
jgi:nitrate/nitrite transporter NarK